MSGKRYAYSRYAMYTHIEKTVRKLSNLKAGKCLVIGDTLNGKGTSTCITDMLPKGCSFESPGYPQVDVHKMPYADNTYDYVVADQVFEHVRKPWIGAEEIRRVLKPNGLLILTSLLIYPIHGVPDDFWRFTPNGLKILCEKFSKIHVSSGSGDLKFAIDVLHQKRRIVTPGTPDEQRALGNSKKHLVMVWIIAEK